MKAVEAGALFCVNATLPIHVLLLVHFTTWPRYPSVLPFVRHLQSLSVCILRRASLCVCLPGGLHVPGLGSRCPLCHRVPGLGVSADLYLPWREGSACHTDCMMEADYSFHFFIPSVLLTSRGGIAFVKRNQEVFLEKVRWTFSSNEAVGQPRRPKPSSPSYPFIFKSKVLSTVI